MKMLSFQNRVKKKVESRQDVFCCKIKLIAHLQCFPENNSQRKWPQDKDQIEDTVSKIWTHVQGIKLCCYDLRNVSVMGHKFSQ